MQFDVRQFACHSTLLQVYSVLVPRVPSLRAIHPRSMYSCHIIVRAMLFGRCGKRGIHITLVEQKKKTINVAALHSILGCFVLGVLFFVATEMERQACFSTVGGTTVVRSLFAYVVWLAHNLRASIAKIPDDCIAAMSVGMLRLHLCDVATAAHAQCHICEGAWTRMVTSAARDGI